MSEATDQLSQCLWLTSLIRHTGLNARNLRVMLNNWPGLPELVSAPPLELANRVQGPPDKVSRLLAFCRDDRNWKNVETQAAAAAKKGIWAIFRNDARFPDKLNQISACPTVLFCRGERYDEIFSKPFAVTVIGTRNPTAYGRSVAERITADLADSQVVIISGLARGIDAIAHRTALKRQGLTVAVVGNGPDLPYPPENAVLMKEIAETGLIISEHPPGTAPLRQNFPARNRILSGLADAVAVIEASSDSGTLITASFAGDQGRDVYAVPGSILSPYSKGCNQLIREGAEILESAADILWRLPASSMQTRLEGWLRQVALNLPGEASDPAELADKPAARLRQILAGGPLPIADIAAALAISMPDTAVLLTLQEMNGSLCCEKGRYSLTERGNICI